MKQNKIPYTLILSLSLTLVPVIAGLIYALGYSTGFIGVLATGFTGTYWLQILNDHAFWLSLGFSLYVGLAAIGTASAIALVLVMRYKDLWLQTNKRFMISLPLVFPAIVTAFLFLQWLSKAGLAARICYRLGFIHNVQSFPDLVNDQYGIGLILAHVLMATPFFTMLFANIYKDNKLDEYKNITINLGGTQSQFYKKIFIPIILRQSLPNLVLYIIFVMGAYEIPLLMGRSYPQMITVYASDKLRRFNLLERPQAYVIAIIYTLLVMLLLTGIFKFQQRATSEKK